MISGARPAMPTAPIGQVRRSIAAAAHAALGEPARERRALGLRADQAAEREVAAAQDRLGDAQVERVLVGEDEIARAGRRVGDLALDGVDRGAADVRRPRRAERRRIGKAFVALVEPVDVDVERRQQRRDRRGRRGRRRAAADGTAARSPASAPAPSASSGANASVTAPPQHWPSDGPSANDCSLRACDPAAREQRRARR